MAANGNRNKELNLNVCLFVISEEAGTIRVTNLSEDTRESDLQDLFSPFGPISRIYLAKDKNTGKSKVFILNALVLNSTCEFIYGD